MKIFDAHIRSDTCSDAELKNLSYFGTAHVLTSAHGSRGFERAEDLLAYFDSLVLEAVPRLERCGLVGHVALGVLWSMQPRRTHYEVWRRLPELLARPEVVAIGEIGAWEDTQKQWDLFERQVKIALELGAKPLLISTPYELKANMTYKMMQKLEKLGFPSERAILGQLDERLLENVVQSGFVGGFTVGASSNKPREAARLVAEIVERLGSARGIVLSSGLGDGSGDVLGIAKTIVSLQDLGVEDSVIEDCVFGNAESFFGGDL